MESSHQNTQSTAEEKDYQIPAIADVDRLGPIKWCYLTFDTELPNPVFTSTSPSASSPPSPPKLDHLISPFAWSPLKKAGVTILSCIAALNYALAIGSYAAASDPIAADYGVSVLAANVGVVTYNVGFSFAPMVLAPFSEINGRYSVFIATAVFFLVLQVCCAVSRSYGGMLVARFFAGIGGSTASSMVAGVVSDMYIAEERNTPMAIFASSTFVGMGLSALFADIVIFHLEWRWVFYIQNITTGIITVAMILFFKETRENILLSRRAQALNKWYEAREKAGYVGVEGGLGSVSTIEKESGPQRIRWKVEADEERSSIATMIKISVSRPFYMLFTEPILILFAIWAAFTFLIVFLSFDAIPLVFSTNHGFNLQQSGAVFTALIVGVIIGTVICVFEERVINYIEACFGHSQVDRTSTTTKPEGRLAFACVASFLLPIGLFWFAWTQFPSIPWIVPALGIGCLGIGLLVVFLAVFNYLADVYGPYASSALAAAAFCRNMLAAFGTLYSNAMFNNLTFQGAGSLLGGLAICTTIAPILLARYGERVRAKSKFASQVSGTPMDTPLQHVISLA